MTTAFQSSSLVENLSSEVEKRGLSRRSASGQALECALKALVIGAAADPNVTCALIDLQLQRDLLNKFLNYYIEIMNSTALQLDLGFGTCSSYAVDVLRTTVQYYNQQGNDVKINLNIITPGESYNLVTYEPDQQHSYPIKHIFIYKADNIRYEGYGYLLTEPNAAGSFAVDPDDHSPLEDNHSCQDTCIKSAEYIAKRNATLLDATSSSTTLLTDPPEPPPTTVHPDTASGTTKVQKTMPFAKAAAEAKRMSTLRADMRRGLWAKDKEGYWDTSSGEENDEAAGPVQSEVSSALLEGVAKCNLGADT